MDRGRAERPSISRGRIGGSGFSRAGTAVPAAAAVDDPHRRGPFTEKVKRGRGSFGVRPRVGPLLTLGLTLGLTPNDPMTPDPFSSSVLTLYPELGLAGPVVSPLDVPVLPEWVVIHRRDEVEGRLELDVIETRFGGDQLMPFAGGDEDQAAGTDRECAGIVLHFARTGFDQIEVLR